MSKQPLISSFFSPFPKKGKVIANESQPPIEKHVQRDASFENKVDHNINGSKRIAGELGKDNGDDQHKKFEKIHSYENDDILNDEDFGIFSQNDGILHRLRDLCDKHSEERHSKTVKIIIDSVERKYEEWKNSKEKSSIPNEEEDFDDLEKDGRKKSKYTPLEQQYLEFSAKYPDAILLVESGYRYKFFGRDAEIASRVLNIRAGWSHNFLSTSIPTIRLSVHLKKLVEEGYKVGVISQMETAALKAISSNKSGPFSRALTGLFTKSTLIDDSVDPLNSRENILANYLMSIYETSDKNEMVKISFVAIRTSVGDIIYDFFEDETTRVKLETALRHLNPIEIILCEHVSPRTKKAIEMFSCQMLNSVNSSVRIQYVKELYFFDNAEKVPKVKNLKVYDVEHLMHSFCALYNYLVDFEIESLLNLSCNYNKFQDKMFMKLDGETLSNLDLLGNKEYQFLNNFESKKKYSFFSIIDRTLTDFGKRLLLEWMKYPLIDAEAIQDRLDSVEYLLNRQEDGVFDLINLFPMFVDLEKGICRAFYGKCTIFEFVGLIRQFKKIAENLPSHEAIGGYPRFLKSIFEDIEIDFGQKICEFVDLINMDAKDQVDLVKDDSDFSGLRDAKEKIAKVQSELDIELENIRKRLNRPHLEYVTRNKDEYIIEIKRNEASLVPTDWVSYPGTKALCRYQTPKVKHLYSELLRSRELLNIESNRVWKDIMSKFSDNYGCFKRVVRSMARLDCLQSLAKLANSQGYTKPIVQKVDTKFLDRQLTIRDGRHPIVEKLLMENQFVSNSTDMSRGGHTCTIITGPNMGGKTCYAKQVAIICIMAQMGSYVPASYFEFYPLDAIYTRMGTHDDLIKGQSSFLVELQASVNIIKNATRNSLVILDELGRGTSTHDGCALAYSILLYILKYIQCWTIFITHYPLLYQVSKIYPQSVKNFHISFFKPKDEASANSESKRIILLHKLVEGVEKNSYGINVASAANLPQEIISRASYISHNLKLSSNRTHKLKIFKQLISLMEIGTPNKNLTTEIRDLHTQLEIAKANSD